MQAFTVVSFLPLRLQFWCGQWHVCGTESPGSHDQPGIWANSPSKLRPQSASGVLPVSIRQRLWPVSKVYVPELLHCQWYVSIRVSKEKRACSQKIKWIYLWSWWCNKTKDIWLYDSLIWEEWWVKLYKLKISGRLECTVLYKKHLLSQRIYYFFGKSEREM